MPHFACFYINDDEKRFLGICEYNNRKAFEVKINALCFAMDWHETDIKWIHCYDNSILSEHF